MATFGQHWSKRTELCYPLRIETFFLGTHQPSWVRQTDVPLFISRRRLANLNRLPRARGPVAIDSGGFTEMSLYGEWSITVKQYIEEIRRYVECLGNVQFAAPMDMMCEPAILKKTGLTVEEHQRRTLDNFRELMQLAPELPWAPALQGWTIGDYWKHAESYQKARIDLAKAPVVGVGSVCRRQSTTRANALIATLQAEGMKLHAFGYKMRGLSLAHEHLQSSDSLAWSFRARRSAPLPECSHPNCSSCLRYALRWRAKLLKLLNKPNDAKEPLIEATLFD